ncbi:MAG: copper transporter [Propionibacteriaceae bacterium]
MINFRYHIVSLMAVFLALSVGIVLGVTLRGPVDEGLVTQAEQDRKQVQDLRTELDRRNALDEYRDAWAQRTGKELTAGMLTQRGVAIIAMPDAPTAVVNDVSRAVTDAGGTVTHTVKVNKDAFDTTKAAAVSTATDPFAEQLQLTETMTSGSRLGLALGRAVLGKQTGERDALATELTEALTGANLATIDGKSTELAELAIVVTAEASEPRPDPEVLTAHVQMDVALRSVAAGVVLAGPNSDGIEGTDVLTARNNADSVDVLSTVDVADLTSGVATTVMAGKEQLLGRQGHYGALTKADAPLPLLPVR